MSEILQLVIPLLLALAAFVIDLFKGRDDRLKSEVVERLAKTTERLVSVIDRQAGDVRSKPEVNNREQAAPGGVECRAGQHDLG